MNEWTVVTVVVTLVGLCAAVVRPLLSLTGTITRLTEIVKALEGNISGIAAKNSESHGKLWDRVCEHDETLCSHETRLTVIESRTVK
ncbi:MAG: hypothetical protein RR147_00865 [Oscillospiraceae bacterium]